MQISIGNISYKITRKKKVFFGMAILAIALSGFALWRSNTPIKSSWQPINKILPQSFTEKLIDKHVKLNSQLSIDAISSTAEAIQLPVENWFAVRFNQRELCSLAGCLNLIVDREEQIQIAELDLYSYDDGNQFRAGERKDCLVAIQTMNGRIVDQSFCKH